MNDREMKKLMDDVSSDIHDLHRKLLDESVKEYDFAKRCDVDEDHAKDLAYKVTATWSRWHKLRELHRELEKKLEKEG